MASGNAIFTEVLEIQVLTDKFASQMKEVEAIYQASINKMNTAGTGSQGAGFSQINTAVNQISQQLTVLQSNATRAFGSLNESASIAAKELNQVAAAAAVVGNEAAAAGAKGAAGVNKIGQAAGSAANSTRTFAGQLERAFLRIPANLIVVAALGAAFEALRAPVDFIVAGLHNLEGQSTAFQEVRTNLSDTFSILESVAARPLFDTILSAMQSLSKWLTDNKELVQQVVHAFGVLIDADLRPLVELMSSKPTGLLSVVNTLATAFGYAVVSVRGLLNAIIDITKVAEASDPMQLLSKGAKKYGEDIKAALADAKKDFDSSAADFSRITAASMGVQNAIEGKGNADIADATPASKLPGSAELMSEFRERRQKEKEIADEAINHANELVATQTINQQKATELKVAALEKERKAVANLIAQYQGLVATAIRRENPGLLEKPETERKVRKAEDTLSRGSSGSTGNFNDAINNQEAAARKLAEKELSDITKADILAEMKLREQAVAAAVAGVKKEVAEGHQSREAGVEADLALEKIRFSTTISEINQKKAAPGSLDATKKQNELDAEQERHNIAIAALEKEKTQAIKQDTDALNAYYAAIAKGNIALKQAEASEDAILGHRRAGIALTKEIIQLKLQEAAAEMEAAKARFAGDVAGSGEAQKDEETILRLQAEIATLKNQLTNASYSDTSLGQQQRREDTGDSTSVGEQLSNALNLGKAQQDWENANNGLEKFTAVAEGASNALGTIKGVVSQFQNAAKTGGIAGGIGSLMSEGTTGKLLGAIPVAGPIINAVGGMISSISSLFGNGIQKLVNAINDKIKNINDSAALGQITLSQQITELQQEKQNAIKQLGGSKKKGAKQQLDSILKSLNLEIAQLKKQQKEIITNFDQMVKALSLGSQVMSDWFNTWTQINQQVKTYVDAGGSLSTAAQFLNEQLEKQRANLQDQLNQGNQTAIGDAIQLNDLLKQRIQMMKDEQALEFGIENADSLERRVSSAVSAGAALTKQRALFQDQLNQTNNEISLAQQKVAVEGKIFDINKSIADLQAASNALTLQSLNEQLAKYQDMQKLLAATNGLQFSPQNISTSASATFGIPGEPTVAGPVNIGSITITVPRPITAANAKTVGQEIARNIRSGRTTFSTA